MQCSYSEPCILQIGQSKLNPIINYTHAFEKYCTSCRYTHPRSDTGRGDVNLFADTLMQESGST
jgi:hypothetical protein